MSEEVKKEEAQGESIKPVEPAKAPESSPVTPSSVPGHWQWLLKVLPTNWRAIVAWLAASTIVAGINYVRGPDEEPIQPPEPPPIIWPNGWIEPSEKDKVEALKHAQKFSDTEANTIGDDEEDAPAWRFYYKLHGKPIPARDQGRIGSCVAKGFAGAIENTLAAAAVLKTGPLQKPVPDIAAEVIYGGSRVNLHGKKPADMVGDGSTGVWAMRWCATGGVLERGVFNTYDLREYNVETTRLWGDQGVPKEVADKAKSNLVSKWALVKTVQEARKSIQQGYFIAICSSVGFWPTTQLPAQRDKDGHLRPNTQWMHCMYLAGWKGGTRPGFLIVNSWGPNWVQGPKGKYDDIPEGSFWADESAIQVILAQEDSYAVASVTGFKKNKIEKTDWLISETRKNKIMAQGSK